MSDNDYLNREKKKFFDIYNNFDDNLFKFDERQFTYQHYRTDKEIQKMKDIEILRQKEEWKKKLEIEYNIEHNNKREEYIDSLNNGDYFIFVDKINTKNEDNKKPIEIDKYDKYEIENESDMKNSVIYEPVINIGKIIKIDKYDKYNNEKIFAYVKYYYSDLDNEPITLKNFFYNFTKKKDNISNISFEKLNKINYFVPFPENFNTLNKEFCNSYKENCTIFQNVKEYLEKTIEDEQKEINNLKEKEEKKKKNEEAKEEKNKKAKELQEKLQKLKELQIKEKEAKELQKKNQEQEQEDKTRNIFNPLNKESLEPLKKQTKKNYQLLPPLTHAQLPLKIYNPLHEKPLPPITREKTGGKSRKTKKCKKTKKKMKFLYRQKS